MLHFNAFHRILFRFIFAVFSVSFSNTFKSVILWPVFITVVMCMCAVRGGGESGIMLMDAASISAGLCFYISCHV